MNKLFSYLPLLALFMVSCVSNREVINLPPSKITKHSESTFSGEFSNSYISLVGDTYGNGKWETLTRILSNVHRPKQKLPPFSDSAVVSLKFSESLLKVEVKENGKIVNQMEFKAKIENDYLSIKRKFYVVPIPLFYVLYDHKIYLAINKHGNLIAKYGYSRGGWFLFMAGGHSGVVSLEYERIKQ